MATIITSISDFVTSLFAKLKVMWQKSGKSKSSIPAEIQSRLRVQKLLDYYAGNHLEYLRTLVAEQFSGAKFRGALLAQPNIRNIVRYLADTVPFTFREGVLVQAANDADQTIISDILDDNRFDNFCRTLDKMVYLCKTVFVKVNWRNEKIVLEIVTPEHVQVKADDFNPYEIEKIGYPRVLNDKDVVAPKGIFCVWDKTNFYYTDEKGNILPNPENPDNVNPYGIIPVVTFREQEPLNNDFWTWPGEELLSAQDNLNVKLTYRNYLYKRFNIPLPVLLGNAKIENGQFPNVDGSEVLQISTDFENANSKFEFITPNTKMAEVLSVIEEEVKNILISQGIDPNLFVQSADRQSGQSIALMNAKLEERRSVAKLAYQYALEELFDVITIVWNTHNPDRKLTVETETETTEIEVKIPEPKTYYSTAADKWTDYQNKLQLNLMTAADILLLERNDLTNRAEAQQQIDDNAAENRSLRLTSLLTGSLTG